MWGKNQASVSNTGVDIFKGNKCQTVVSIYKYEAVAILLSSALQWIGWHLSKKGLNDSVNRNNNSTCTFEQKAQFNNYFYS